MLAEPPRSLVVFHAGSADFAEPQGFRQARTNAEFLVYIGAYACSGVRSKAHAVLPIGLPPEIDGSYTNLDGTVQSTGAASRLPGEARPGWKVLRALGSALSLDGFGFTTIDEVRVQMSASPVAPKAQVELRERAAQARSPYLFERITTTAIYRSDAVLRRSPALNAHPLRTGARVALNPADAAKLGVNDGEMVRVEETHLPVCVDRMVPAGAAWIEAGYRETAGLPRAGAALTITKVPA
jgi:NADH-quinone oxidoreductase subunit G